MAEKKQNPGQVSSTMFRRGFVKQVLCGDAVVLQGTPNNGPPKEVTVYLSYVFAPRLAKRPTETEAGKDDEPFAWEAREFLRTKIVGQTVMFKCDFTTNNGRDHGRIFLGGTGPGDAENVTEVGVAEGWLEVRQTRTADEHATKLYALQESAKASRKGKWAPEEVHSEHIRHITWVVEDMRSLLDSHKQRPVKAIIEHVRDASTYRAILLPHFQYITLLLSGVKAPTTRTGVDGKVDEYAEQAKYFVECRILQRDVEIILEGISNQNFVASIVHPKGNIAVLLLENGFAKCVDWSITLATSGHEPLRTAERSAKIKKLRLWREYQPSNSNVNFDRKCFMAKVLEVIMGDALVVQNESGAELKIWLSSIKPPREENRESDKKPAIRSFRPLYDIPYMYEAREFLRKRLVGRKVQVLVDYVQPKSDNFPEKTCCTVTIGGVNIGEALVSKGLAKVVRHRNDDENRSSCYDSLLTAEAKADKAKKGLFSVKEEGVKNSIVRVQELQGDAQRSKQFLPYLQRSGRSEALVEFIASGSRVRLYVPKETCLITFLLSGITCPRSARIVNGGMSVGESEPFAEEARKFTKSNILQNEVEIEVEGMDKNGNFIGYLFFQNEKGSHNMSVELVETGFASVHFTAERGSYYGQLLAAEERAKQAKLGIWQHVDENEGSQMEAPLMNDKTERAVNFKNVVVTDVQKRNMRFTAQNVEDGPKLEKMMHELREELLLKSAMIGSYVPRRGELCVAQFSEDKLWYRARIENMRGKTVDVLYIDFGNRETVGHSSLAAIPTEFAKHPPGAKEYQLALIQMPNRDDYAELADSAFQQILCEAKQVLLNSEYRLAGVEYVQALIESPGGTKTDIARYLIEEGLALAEHRREPRFAQMIADYAETERNARTKRKNIWEYGDFTGEEL